MNEVERDAFNGWALTPRFSRKVEQASRIIEEALKIGPAYVACSWGKDSIVMLHIAQRIMPNIRVVHFSDARQDMLDNYSEVINEYTTRFPINYLDLQLGGDRVPHNVARAKLWEEFAVAIVGVRKEESNKRKIIIAQYGTIHQYTSGKQKGSWRAYPLAFFSWQDVWSYIVRFNLPYLKSYDHPGNQNRSLSRTCVRVAVNKRNPSAMQFGRIAYIRQFAPEYWHYLAEFYPEITAHS